MNDLEKLQHYMTIGGFKEYKDIANFLEVSPSRVSDWKKNGRVPKKHLDKLGEKYGFILGSPNEDYENKKYEKRRKESEKNSPELLTQRMEKGGRTAGAYAKSNGLQTTAVRRLLNGKTTGCTRNSDKQGSTYEVLKCFKRDGIWHGLLPFAESSSVEDDVFSIDNIVNDLQRLENESKNISENFRTVIEKFKKSLLIEKGKLIS